MSAFRVISLKSELDNVYSAEHTAYEVCRDIIATDVFSERFTGKVLEDAIFDILEKTDVTQ